MPDYIYVSPEEVQRVCRDIGISDWTALEGPGIDIGEAEVNGCGFDLNRNHWGRANIGQKIAMVLRNGYGLRWLKR